MENKLTPEVRFPWFSGGWEERKLGDVADIVGGGTPSTKVEEYWNGEIDWYSPAEIREQIYLMGSQKKITHLGLQKSSARILPMGTVLFTSRAGIGNTAILEKEGSTNQGFQSILPHKNELDNYFIFSLSHELKKYGETNGAGSTFVEVSGKQMTKMHINLPKIEEQSQIGLFFKQLDDTIALQQQELDTLKQTKQGFLQKMFPKNGAKNPEFRFAGFTDDWEERKLKEITSDISDGDWIEKEHIFDRGDFRIIQTGNLGVGEYLDKGNNAKYIPTKSFNELKANEIFPGDLLTSRLADPAGRTIILPDIHHRMVTAVDVTVIRPNNYQFDSVFLMTQLNSKSALNKVSTNVSGTSHKRISRKNLEQIILNVPVLEEQQRIGLFFKQLDDTIALHQRELDVLKETKKAFLQKMFV